MDLEREILELRDRVSTVESHYLALVDKIEAGDRNVRQGTETVKESMQDLKKDVSRIAVQILGEEGKTALREDIQDLKNGMDALRGDLIILDRKFDKHDTEHALEEGGRRRSDRFAGRWMAPVITGLMIGLPSLLISLAALARATP